MRYLPISVYDHMQTSAKLVFQKMPMGVATNLRLRAGPGFFVFHRTFKHYIYCCLFNIQFYEVMADPMNLKRILCDYNEFSNTFTFPNGTSVMEIQEAMCGMVQNTSSSIDQLINLFGAGNVLSEVSHYI